MILDHGFTAREVRAATGFSLPRAQAAIDARAERKPETGIRLRPYPGGRHPRIGFLEGAVAPQRESKVSVFTPWKDGGYVVIDVPEAVFSNLGLTYLAHTHVPTIWDETQKMKRLEWSPKQSGLSLKRRLPNAIELASEVQPIDGGVAMRIDLTNGTAEPLTKLRVQVCTMLKGAVGFNLQEPGEVIESGSFVALKSFDADRWVITSWEPNHRAWTNPPVPCVHSDPIFPDCPPGDTVTVRGGLWFYEGTDALAEIKRLQTLKDQSL